MTLDIIPREAWSRIEPRRVERTTPRRCFCHHTVGGDGVPDRNEDGDSGDDYLRIVEHVHINVNGWDDVAYNFFIDPVGLEIYEGQGWGREPNAQRGFNKGTWAVAVIGDFRRRHPNDYPGLLDRIAELVAYGRAIGELPDVPLEGHRDAPGSEGNTCPGPNLYSALPEINRLIKEEPMALTDRDIERIWQHTIPDMDDQEGRRGLAHAVKQAWRYSIRAAEDAAVARRLIEQGAATGGTVLTQDQIEAIGEEVADELHERLRG